MAAEIVRQLPSEDLIYLGDTERFPYGPKPLEDVRNFVLEIVDFFVHQPVKLVVVACNTGAAAGLASAQKRFKVPIMGVVEPGARGAVEATLTRHVGVIGTAGTVASGAYVEALRMLDAGVEVIQRSCPLFADLVERGEVDGPAVKNLATEYLAPLKEAGVDALILGCTHYPLLAPVIGDVMGSDVALIDSAQETAREVRDILTRRGQLRDDGKPARRRFLATGDVAQFLELGVRIFGDEIQEVEKVSLAGMRPEIVPQEVARLR